MRHRTLPLLVLSLAMTLSSAASAQESAFKPESEIVVKRSYVAACEANVAALEEAARWVDHSDGSLAECRRASALREKRVEALAIENDRLTQRIEKAPSPWVWVGAGAAGVLVVEVILFFVLR